MITILRGPFQSGKTTHVLSLVKTALREGSNPILIVPSRIQRDYFTQLLTSERGFAGKTIFTLSEAVNSIMAGSNEPATVISDFESFILLKLIIEENKKHFHYFKDITSSGSLVRLLFTLITELRAGGVRSGSESYIKEFQACRDIHCLKWQDLFFIYEEYEARLSQNRLCDSYKLLQLAGDKAQKNGLPGSSFLALDGFFDFTVSQFDFVASLIQWHENQGIPVYMTLPDDSSPLIQETERMFSARFSCKWIDFPLNQAKNDSAPSLFQEDAPVLSRVKPEYQTLQGFGKYREMERIANEIKKLVQEKDYSYNDIAVIASSSDDYSPIIKSIFRDFNIPYYSSRDDKLQDNPVILYLYSFIKIALKESAIDNMEILAAVNSNYLANPEYKTLRSILSLFPFYIKAGKDKWLSEMEKKRAQYQESRVNSLLDEDDGTLDALEKKLEKLNQFQPVLEKFLDIVLFPQNTLTIDDFIGWLSRLLAEFQVQKAVNQTAPLEGILSAQDFNAFRKIKEALTSLKKILTAFGKTEFSRAEFFQFFEALIKDIHYRYRYYPVDAVKVLTPFDARETSFKAVFITGLNEGEFPGKLSLSLAESYEKRRLNDYARKLILQDNENRSSAEKLNFSLSVSRASERVYLCHTPFDESGRELLPSVYLIQAMKAAGISTEAWKEQTSRIFDIVLTEANSSIYDINLLLTNEYLGLPPEIRKEWSGKRPLFQHANRMAQYRQAVDGVNLLYETLPGTHADPAKIYLGSLDFDNPTPGNQQNREALKKSLDAMKFSSSRLETFGNCRYQFFLKYILSVYSEKYPSQEIESTVKGQFLHAVLKSYLEKTKDAGGAGIISDFGRYSALLDKAFQEAAPEFLMKEGEKGLFSMELAHYRLILRDFIHYEADELRDRKPAEFEYPLDCELSVPKVKPLLKVPTVGSIDRVDESDSAGNKTYRILDYKTGNVKHFKADFKIPLRLFQGFIYARAYAKKVDEISYVSIESQGKGRKTDILPYKDRYNRSTRECDLVMSSFEEIWEQKEREILEIFKLIEKGDFSPYTAEGDYDPALMQFYQRLADNEAAIEYETDNKCGFCQYQEACLRGEKRVAEYFR